MSTQRDRFVGQILGVGTTAGPSVVVGRWARSPLGAFVDVMVAEPGGRRVLLAPSRAVADYVAATYSFDAVEVHPVRLDVVGDRWTLDAGPLRLELRTGRRRPLGAALRLVPRRLATSTGWAAAVDPLARVLLRGVRTHGSAGSGRREWYAATDCHRVVAATGSYRGVDVGTLAPVDPPVTFGFASTPRTPSLTEVTTTVEVPAAAAG